MQITMLMPLLQQGVLLVKLLPDMAKDSTMMLQYSDASDFQFQDLCWSESTSKRLIPHYLRHSNPS